MIVVTCLSCALAVRVLPDVSAGAQAVAEVDWLVGKGSDFWPNRYPCPRCGQHASGLAESAVDPRALALLEVRDLTAQEAFVAFHGLGFPEERACSVEVLQELLTTQPVVRVVGSNITGAQTVHVDALELRDGTRVHLGAGASGAVVFRIVRPAAYAQRVQEEGVVP